MKDREYLNINVRSVMFFKTGNSEISNVKILFPNTSKTIVRIIATTKKTV